MYARKIKKKKTISAAVTTRVLFDQFVQIDFKRENWGREFFVSRRNSHETIEAHAPSIRTIII